MSLTPPKSKYGRLNTEAHCLERGRNHRGVVRIGGPPTHMKPTLLDLSDEHYFNLYEKIRIYLLVLLHKETFAPGQVRRRSRKFTIHRSIAVARTHR